MVFKPVKNSIGPIDHFAGRDLAYCFARLQLRQLLLHPYAVIYPWYACANSDTCLIEGRKRRPCWIRVAHCWWWEPYCACFGCFHDFSCYSILDRMIWSLDPKMDLSKFCSNEVPSSSLKHPDCFGCWLDDFRTFEEISVGSLLRKESFFTIFHSFRIYSPYYFVNLWWMIRSFANLAGT